MKKNIMSRAWEISRNAVAKFGGKCRMYLAEALRQAWAEAKAPVKVSYTGFAHVEGDGWSPSGFDFKAWAKGGHRRIYVNKGLNGKTLGYIDLNRNNEYVSSVIAANKAVEYFLAHYAI